MKDIADEIRNDPEKGARRLESEYKAGLTALARRLCADEGDAEELVNRTFSEVVRSIDSYLEQSAFFGWMCQILVNIRSKELRRKANRTVSAAGDVGELPDDDAAARLFRDVDASLLRDAVQALPADMREAVVMRYFMDLPLRRMAKILGVPEGTVNSRLHYARLALAAKLDAHKCGVRAFVVALTLAAGFALGRFVYTQAPARGAGAAEPAGAAAGAEASESPADGSDGPERRAAPSSALFTYSTTQNHNQPMKATPLLAAATLSLAAAAAPGSDAGWTVAAGPWVYDSAAKTLTSADGGTVLPSVGVYNAARKELQMNRCTVSVPVDELDFSAGVADGWKILRMSQTFDWQAGTNHLRRIVLSDETEWTGGWLFRNSTQLQEFVGGAGLKTLGGSAFLNCTALTNVVLRDGLETVGGMFLSGTKALKHFELPQSVTDIEASAFRSSSFTNDFAWPPRARELRSGTFVETSFRRFIAPTGFSSLSVTDYNAKMFSGTKLEEVVFPAGFSAYSVATNGAALFADMSQPIKVFWRSFPESGFEGQSISFNGFPFSIKHYIAKQNSAGWERYARERPDIFTMPTGTEAAVLAGKGEAGSWKSTVRGTGAAASGAGMPVYLWDDPWAHAPPTVIVVR